MYANTGIATDSARVARSAKRARLLAGLARRLFVAPPMPDLAEPPGLAKIARRGPSGAAPDLARLAGTRSVLE